jgi:PAS domain S-box-containing protein
VSRKFEVAVAARLEHELSLSGLLKSEWAARPLALVHLEGRPALLLEDPGGRPADRLVGKIGDLDQFLTLAIGLASVVGKLHDQGLIHKDIRPATILVDSSNKVFLTGFGFASHTPRESHGAAPPEAIAGSLAYMAPEQTGRMNRSIDARSDLYAVGTTLYEILVGALPFAAADPMEWIHCHIARAPPPPSVRLEGIPQAIDAILLKLLAKNAEERFQTAGGLEHDLWRCREALRGHRIESFTLSERDASEALLIPEKLYGREMEIDALLQAYDRVATGGGFDLLLVSGYPGVGKSSLVNELLSRLNGTNALFAAAKFDQSRREIPFATLGSAFQGLVRHILSLDDVLLAEWRNALARALGRSARLIVDLVPDLALLLGDPASPPPLSSAEERSRFHFIIRQFIGVFASAEHPLVLFLDDLQWLDPATLELFESLCVAEEIPYLFLVGTYRDNAIDRYPELLEVFERIGATRGALNRIRLNELTFEDVTKLVAESVRVASAAALGLAELVHQKTNGNAFFVVQFLTTLESDGLLRFDREARIWRWDVDLIRHQGITENVAELVAGRLLRYRGTERDVITQLACMGNGASARFLAAALDFPEATVDAALSELVAASLIRRSEGGYTFTHDGVQDAAYALVSEPDRAAMHLRAGRLLARDLARSEREEEIYGVVNQLNRATALLTTPEERMELAELNLVAGKRAKTATAYDSAISYLSLGCELLPADGWERAYRLAFELELHLVDCKFVTGQIEFAERRLLMLTGRSSGLSDLATVVGRQMILYNYLGQIEKAHAIAIDCLSRIGIIISSHPTHEDIEREYRDLQDNIAGRVIEDFVDLPAMTDELWLDAMNLLTEALGPAGVINSSLIDLLLLRMTNISLTRGNCDASCHAYANLGARVLRWRFQDMAAGRAFGRLALRLIDERGFDRYASRVYTIISGVDTPWSAPLRESFEIAFRAIEMPRERGGIVYSGFGWVCGLTALLGSGKNLGDVERLVNAGLAAARRTQFAIVIEFINAQRALVRSLREEGINEENFHGNGQSRADYETYLASGVHLWHAVLRYNIRRLQFLVFFEKHEACGEIMQKVERDFGPPPILAQSPVFEVVEYCFFSGLARAATLTCETAIEDNHAFVALRTSQAWLARWAEQCPANFASRALLLAAEIARLEARDLDAQRLYEEAAQSARDHESVQIEALTQELAGRFYEARGFGMIAEAYRRSAHACYLRWGADAKARQLERLYSYLGSGSTRSVVAADFAHSRFQDLDLAVVIEMYHALSGEIVLERLIQKLMATVVETAGAVRGVLLLPQNDEMRVVAEARTTKAGVAVDILARSHPVRELPRSVVNYTARSREPVILGNATEHNPYSTDEYFSRAAPRSILCLPLLKQQRLVGLLYLENDLASHIFTPDRLSLLQLLASQAAISLENAELFQDVKKTQEQARRVGEDLRHSFDMIPALAWRASPQGLLEFANKQWHDFTGISPPQASGMPWIEPFYAEDRDKVADKWRHLLEFNTSGEFEARMQRYDGEVRRFLVRAIPMRDDHGNVLSWHGTNTDIENLKRAEQAQEALARVSRITAMGELTVSIAHEINQPLMAIVTNAAACLRWLADDRRNVAEARIAAERIMRHGHRAGDVIASIRALAKKASPEPARLDLREVILEVLLLARNELDRHSITTHTGLAADNLIIGDRVQMQQVLLNLVMNSIEAMAASKDRMRVLKIGSQHVGGDYLQTTVSDTGIGIAQPDDAQIFDVFFTTKSDGVGIGLSICRSIVEVHHGRLWATPNLPHGTAFHFTVPKYQEGSA